MNLYKSTFSVNEFFQIGKFSLPISIIVIISFSILTYYLAAEEALIYALGSVVIIPIAILMFQQPKYWIYGVFLIFPFYIQDDGIGVSTSDVLIAVFYMVTLGLWLLDAFFISKKRLVFQVTDFLLLLFFFLATLTSFYTVDVDTTLLSWFKDFSKHFVVLYYFPIRYYFSSKNDSKIFLFFFFVILFCTDLIQLFKFYYNISTDLKSIYEVSFAGRINQVLYTTMIPAGFIFLYFVKDKYLKLFILLVTFATIGELIITLSRTFWVITIGNIFIIFLYLTFKQKVKFLLIILLGVTFISVVAYNSFGSRYKLMSSALEKRFSSTGNGSKDESFRSRLTEWDKVFIHIDKFPLGGLGYGKTFNFKPSLIKNSITTLNIHNGYIAIVFRTGYPLAILFWSLFAYGLGLTFYLSIKFNDDFYKPLSIACFLGYSSMFIANFTSAQIFYRDSVFISALLFYCSSMCQLRYNEYCSSNQDLLLLKS